ncbi:FAD-dependent oxidoreductase [Mycobacterium uberis]|uniref:FAD-dependent oxidoreductase n=1 Tax=Mycobacterium uberis TaxID=2162698 RepID=UPI00243699C1|nr:FAD-dependent oxidoreductase [Mycobacterium uberis]
MDPAAHTVGLPDATALQYDKLLVTGSTSRRPPIPGSDAAGVGYLRTCDDASALNSILVETPSLAMPGIRWIGLEVAATMCQRGVNVTVVEAVKKPLMTALRKNCW